MFVRANDFIKPVKVRKIFSKESPTVVVTITDAARTVIGSVAIALLGDFYKVDLYKSHGYEIFSTTTGISEKPDVKQYECDVVLLEKESTVEVCGIDCTSANFTRVVIVGNTNDTICEFIARNDSGYLGNDFVMKLFLPKERKEFISNTNHRIPKFYLNEV